MRLLLFFTKVHLLLRQQQKKTFHRFIWNVTIHSYDKQMSIVASSYLQKDKKYCLISRFHLRSRLMKIHVK